MPGMSLPCSVGVLAIPRALDAGLPLLLLELELELEFVGWVATTSIDAAGSINLDPSRFQSNLIEPEFYTLYEIMS